jgi:hypothetical protein
MNQSVIINDDYVYDKKLGAWKCTAVFSGNLITVFLYSKVGENELDQSTKFDWEYIIEDWLEDNEPDDNNQIIITTN